MQAQRLFVLRDHGYAVPEPLPVHLVYPHAKLMSARVRAFVDACVAALRGIRFE